MRFYVRDDFNLHIISYELDLHWRGLFVMKFNSLIFNTVIFWPSAIKQGYTQYFAHFAFKIVHISESVGGYWPTGLSHATVRCEHSFVNIHSISYQFGFGSFFMKGFLIQCLSRRIFFNLEQSVFIQPNIEVRIKLKCRNRKQDDKKESHHV